MSATIKSLLSDLVDYIFGDPIPAPEVIEDGELQQVLTGKA